MQLGIHFMNFTLPGRSAELPTVLADTAKIADQAGAARSVPEFTDACLSLLSTGD